MASDLTLMGSWQQIIATLMATDGYVVFGVDPNDRQYKVGSTLESPLGDGTYEVLGPATYADALQQFGVQSGLAESGDTPWAPPKHYIFYKTKPLSQGAQA